MKRKNPYSVVNVKNVRIDSLANAHRGQPATLGVDVGKGELVACLVWPDESFERPWQVRSPDQVRLLVATMMELNTHCPVTVAMESSSEVESWHPGEGVAVSEHRSRTWLSNHVRDILVKWPDRGPTTPSSASACSTRPGACWPRRAPRR